ncbi:MAG: TrkH family potassium uptake protein [Desertimonas sp.]
MRERARSAAVSNPARMTVVAFGGLIAIGTLLLRLPFAVDSGHPGTAHALFTSTSAVTVTGLASFEIDKLTLFGELVVLGLIQVGGFGIMTISSVLALLASRRLGLRQRMRARTEFGDIDIGDMRRLLGAVGLITLTVELTIAVALFLRFWATGQGVGRAAYGGVFHAISAFNNAGFALRSDSLMSYAGDPVVLVLITVAIIAGGLGFPVVLELVKRRGTRMSLHARVTLTMTVTLLIAGPLIIGTFEWTNPDTIGAMPLGDKLANTWMMGVSPRTAGFNAVDIGAANPSTLMVMIVLMFIGGGPASTAGGVKVTTFAVLGYVLWSEVRGDADVNLFHRRLPAAVLRQAIAVVLLAVGAITGITLILLAASDVTIGASLFEATSAFGTVGLSTGITPGLPTISLMSLVLLMFVGRLGPVTMVTALVLRGRRRLYTYPEERPIIG